MLSFKLFLFHLVEASLGGHIFQTDVENSPAFEDVQKVYEVKWFNQTLDHFTFTTSKKFQQKYLVNDTFWNSDGGPIFFYTGNEGKIESFAENTGFMWDIADEFGAMLVFAEHRYYGESLPFGEESKSKDPSKVGYLSSSQALADYVDLITYIRKTVEGAQESPVIAFGGSYGGMLSAWIRTKYPHIVQGAIAGSAPIAQFTSPCDAFGRIVTSDFSAAGVNGSCSTSIRASWSAFDRVSKLENKTGLDWINENFKLCDNSKLTSSENVTLIKAYLTDLWTNLAMMDYPYPTSFLSPLPANPVSVACQPLSQDFADDKELLTNIFEAASVYFNFTGDAKCLNIQDEDDIGADMWSYQACTEMVMPFCYDGVNDMFETATWDLEAYTEQCQELWGEGAVPQPHLADSLYGGRNLDMATNIVFTNGLLDPWSSGGVLKSSETKNGVVAIIIPEGAHHLDLRGSDPADPLSVRQARKQEKTYIQSWIKKSNLQRSKAFGL